MTTRTSKATRLSDTQLILLGTAAGRDDHNLMPIPECIKARGIALLRAIRSLETRGHVEEVPAPANGPHWRVEEDGTPMTFRLTLYGRQQIEGHGDKDDAPSGAARPIDTGKAGGPVGDDAAEDDPSTSRTISGSDDPNLSAADAGVDDTTCPVTTTPDQQNRDAESPSYKEEASAPAAISPAVGCAPSSTSPRTSRTLALLALLRQEDGATLEDLMQASGWQAHSVRGFLSGTVKKKHGLALQTEVDAAGTRRYRITD